ncbi:MAG: PorP/SprF family type IX secretion system membrane protein [Cytophagaceae bacterium]|nr:PorP/SprF family type IX secretion system membrane protein [Cytophagaceae bacterium]MBP6093534.1 PorP/SprF family type IX secretion system membrane protein [Cytophagaceae bacterium]
MRFLIPLLFFMGSFVGFAQQTPQFTQFMMNKYVYNPAFAGYEDYVDIKSGFRTQWTGINTSNKTAYLTANLALDKSDRTSNGRTPFMSKTIRRNFSPTYIRQKTKRSGFHQGIGIQAYSDQIGGLTSNSIAGTYAYHLSVGGENKVAVGATAGYYFRTLNMSGFNVKDPGDPFIMYQDQNLPSLTPSGQVSGGQSLVNVGALFYNRNFYIGLSANQLIFDSFSYLRTSNGSDTLTRKTFYPDDADSYKVFNQALLLGTTNPNIFLQTGMEFKSGEFWTYSPSLLIKYMKGVSWGAEANMRVTFNEAIWTGATYRHKEAIGFMFGMHLSQQINLTYSYETHINGPMQASLGSHELVLALKFRNKVYSVDPAY